MLDVHGSSVRVRDVPVREAMVISPGTGLLELLSLFQQSGNRQKVAFLSHHPSATRAALASGTPQPPYHNRQPLQPPRARLSSLLD